MAGGHDVCDLELAIDVVEKALIVLKAEREKAVNKFKADGVWHCVLYRGWD